jgi:import inner membrane translocase subunit TIM22
MGIFMGMLFGALETPMHAETMTARQNFMHAARTMSTKSVQMAKTFSVMGAIFAGTECVFEKVCFN